MVIGKWLRDFYTYFTAHAQKRLFWNFRSKIRPRHSLRRHRFPIRRVYFHYPMTLWLWPSTFWPWRCLKNKELDTSYVLANSQLPTIICSW